MKATRIPLDEYLANRKRSTDAYLCEREHNIEAQIATRKKYIVDNMRM